jgi:hypothetical protein
LFVSSVGYGLLFSYNAQTLEGITSNGGYAPTFVSMMVSPDGSTLYAVGPDSSGVNYLYSIDAATLFPISNVQVTGSAAALSTDGTAIYILGSPAANTLAIQVVDSSTLATTASYPVTLPSGARLYTAYLALAPGGTTLYVSASTSSSKTPLMLIDVSTGAQTDSKTYYYGPIAF